MKELSNDKFCRISKRLAKKLYNEGKDVYVLPCNIRLEDTRFDNKWFPPISLKGFRGEFEHVVDSCTYYNCNYETGKYLMYFRDNI